MVDRFIRFVVLGLVRVFYRRIEILGREHLPATGPRSSWRITPTACSTRWWSRLRRDSITHRTCTIVAPAARSASLLQYACGGVYTAARGSHTYFAIPDVVEQAYDPRVWSIGYGETPDDAWQKVYRELRLYHQPPFTRHRAT